MRNLSVFRFSFQIKENFCADFNFLSLVGSYKMSKIGCNVAKAREISPDRAEAKYNHYDNA